jgi:starch-binding outer membrane protein, SusD/RagB family
MKTKSSNHMLFILLLCVGSTVFSSCKKFLEISPAPDLIETKAVFTSDKTALSAISGIYYNLRLASRHFTNGGMGIYAGLSADELYSTSPNSTYDPFFTNNLLPKNSTLFTNIWKEAYETIYRCNAIIEGLQTSTGVSDSVKRQLTGETKTIRSWMYFSLINLFGDVPLVLSSNYEVNAAMPRTSASLVYDQIISDLQEAQNLLRSNYPTQGKARPNKYTASALLSRVYLYKKNWSKAEEEATAVIQSGSYNLLADPDKVFLINNSETIWEIGSDYTNTATASFLVPTSSTTLPPLAITSTLLNSFEIGDVRKAKWLKFSTVSGINYYYPFKYKEKSATPIKEYQVVFRLAEQYLIRAEARAQQGDVPGAQADLNTIRVRALLPPTIANTVSSLLTAIYKERQVELFSEWGDRWMDLKRTGTADAVLSAFKGSTWQTTDALYPIPESQLLYNPFLTQNPGY